MAIHDRIVTDPRIMLGKPVIRGTRVTVKPSLRKLPEGADEHAILKAYPYLKKEDVQAAVGYAADTLAHEEVLVQVAG